MNLFDLLKSWIARWGPGPEPPPPAADGDWATRLLVLHNLRRPAAYPLRLHPTLMRAAAAHASRMAAAGRLFHSDLRNSIDPGGAGWWQLGENIAAGQADADAVFSAWMGDRPHRENILNTSYQCAGFAVATAADSTPYWCADYGRPN